MNRLVLASRLVFGAWMLLNGLNYLMLGLWPAPQGHGPLSIQLMDALVHSRLLEVVMVMQLVAGALLLAGLLVPLALCALMPLSSCALFWAVILDHHPVNMLLAVLAFILNGGLMVAWLPAYDRVLGRYSQALGESAAQHDSYDALFVNPTGATPRSAFIPAMVTVVLAIVFFAWMVTGRTADFCMLVLMYPLFVLLARRLRDMGMPVLLVLVPLVPALAFFLVRLGYIGAGGSVQQAMTWLALALLAVFIAWGSATPSRG